MNHEAVRFGADRCLLINQWSDTEPCAGVRESSHRGVLSTVWTEARPWDISCVLQQRIDRAPHLIKR